MTFPADLLYTKDHEWIKVEGDIAVVGITDFAQKELGDIVYIDVDTVDETVEVEEVFGNIEAVKTVSDLFMPVTGEVVEFNDKLEDEPELANKDPYGDGWIVKVKFSDESQLENLMKIDAYKAAIGVA